MSDDLLGAALAFVGDGLPVFPCEPRGKRPLVEGGFKAATRDTEQIRTWWTKWRLANIGIPTGAVSGLVVLDIDPGGDNSLAALTGKFGSLPETRSVRTGRGRQLWFKHPGTPLRCSAGVLGPGLDFRGDGGYVITPPSIHPNGARYSFLNDYKPAQVPNWLVERLTTNPQAQTNPSRDAGGKIPDGRRNDTLAGLAGSLRRQGLPESEILETLCGINLRQCNPPLAEAEVSRIAASIASYPPVAPPDAAERLAKLECFAAIQPKPLRWVWRDRIPAGKLSLMVGDPDKGKSLITIDITARITAGKPFPDGAPSERGSVIMLSAEDDPEDTIRPRLDAAGADVSRVHLLKAVRVLLRDGKQTERGFSLESDIDALYDAIKQTPDVRLIVIDPISAYLGAADSHNNSEVRGLLAPLAELAARTGVAILAVTHLRKSGGSAIYRAMGSIAFAAAARAVWGIAEDADDPDKRIMVRVKGNLAHDPGGLAYRIEVALDIPRIAWELGAVNLRADDVLGGLDSREERSEQREAEEWLKEFLAHGPKAVSEIRRQAPQAGLAWHTVRRAADALRIKKQKSGFVSGWEWALPEDAHPEGAHPCVSDMGTFEAAIENKGDTTQHSHEDAQPESVSTFGGVSSFEEGEL